MTFEREESEQLPEEGPGVVDDTGDSARDGATENPGGADEAGQATGNPPADENAD